MLNVYLHAMLFHARTNSAGSGFVLEFARDCQIEVCAHANRIPLCLKTRYSC
jgi:hypothetical protein